MAQLTQLGQGDGLTIDIKGNLYVSRPRSSAVEVVTPTGQSLGLIQYPEAASHCTFGGTDLKTLYVSAQTSLYAAKMEAAGYPPGTRGNTVSRMLADPLWAWGSIWRLSHNWRSDQ